MAGPRIPLTGWERKPIEAPAEPPPSPLRTFIDPGAVFEGSLRLREDIQIDCEFRGEIQTEGTLVVGPAGCVEGNIRAREVVIEGAVVGNVAARRQLTLRAGARLHGDIETACLEIEKHAFFNGGTRMLQPLAELRDAPPAAPPPV